MISEQTAQVRRFNRLVTQRTGALNDHFLGRARPLGGSRVLFEIGPEGADLSDIRSRLNLDSGYLSRVVQSLVSSGLVLLRPGAEDARARRAYLTPAGHLEVEEMNQRSDQAAEDILSQLTDAQRERLVAAMAEVHQLLKASGIIIERVDPASLSARWCVAQYFAELSRRFERGFDPLQSISADDGEMRPPHGAFLAASVDGEVVACGAIKPIEPEVGSIKRMWVANSVRGLGIGKRMLRALELQARELSFKTIRLETNRALTEAIHLYRSSGYVEIPAFNKDPYADFWFEKQVA
jgi:DNA-binding MarR family transcriptional regulator/predicted GNAT family acetyltransferase